MARWLLKSEPDVFSYDDLVRAGREGWDGIRSYQARNFMREMQRGEQAIFYHSNAKPPGVAGICKIVKTAEPDPTQFDPNSKYYDAASKPEDPRWDWVTVAPVRALPFVSLDELRTLPELADCRLLARGNRLSVFPVTDAEFDAIVAFAEATHAASTMTTLNSELPRQARGNCVLVEDLRHALGESDDLLGGSHIERRVADIIGPVVDQP